MGTAPGVAGQSVYSATFKPSQLLNTTTGAIEDSVLTAIATDSLNFEGVSAGVQVKVVLGGSSGGAASGTPPTISMTAPAVGANLVVNTPVTLTATAASQYGNVAEVDFSVGSTIIQKVTAYPYSTTWTPTNLGFYTLSAEVTDNLGNKTNSSPVPVQVVAQPVPVVSVTSPSSGGTVTVGTPFTITVSATSQSGTISQVQFYENGVLIGTSTTAPYSIQFTPQSTGIFTLTAIATDNADQTTTSSSTVVDVAPANTSAGTTVYFGNYIGLTDQGIFAFVLNDGVLATYIGVQTAGPANTAAVNFIPDLQVSTGGSFELDGSIQGLATTLGVSGTLSPNGEDYIGGLSLASGYSIASGYFTGNLGGVPNSNVAAIVGIDGRIMVYVTNGSYTDAGFGDSGTVGSDGSFAIPTANGNTITGTVNPKTALLTAAFSGPSGGTIIAGCVTGGTFSDGILRNIATRGSVGAGANAMVAGFVVDGTANKQLLIRASGPALTSLGVSGAVAGTVLTVMDKTGTVVASNTGWSSTPTNESQVQAADTTTGAFPFAVGSADSALVGAFAPGPYTAEVAGLGGDTGIGLVEVYDLDTVVPFTPNKLVDVSTRGDVGTGGAVLIGGFVVNGSSPKRLLIRGAGPGLGQFSVTGFLATPHLQLIDKNSTVIRENYTWGTGNDPGLISTSETASGAFMFAPGSADSAILITLNPGSYTVELSGLASSTGTALVEVYEVP